MKLCRLVDSLHDGRRASALRHGAQRLSSGSAKDEDRQKWRRVASAIYDYMGETHHAPRPVFVVVVLDAPKDAHKTRRGRKRARPTETTCGMSLALDVWYAQQRRARAQAAALRRLMSSKGVRRRTRRARGGRIVFKTNERIVHVIDDDDDCTRDDDDEDDGR